MMESILENLGQLTGGPCKWYPFQVLRVSTRVGSRFVASYEAPASRHWEEGKPPSPVACAKVERSGLEINCLHAVRIQEGGRAVWGIRWKARMLAAIGSWHAVTAGAPWFWPALSLGTVRRSGAPARNPRANAGTAVPDACRGWREAARTHAGES